MKKGIGFDIGTCNLVSARQEDNGDTIIKKYRDCFLNLTKEQVQFLKFSNIDYIKKPDSEEIFVLGDAALGLANMFNREVKRPLSKGVISPSETDAFDILHAMIKNLLGDPLFPGEICYYGIPAQPVDDPEQSIIYHESLFGRIISSLGFTPKSANEAQAIIFSECADTKFSGLAISFGAGMANCISGNTKIPLLNGTISTIKELSEKYKPEKYFWVFSCKENGEIVPGKAFFPRKTGTKKIIRITFDNDKFLDCTPDHNIMLRNGKFIEAKNLNTGDSLMPLYTKFYKGKKSLRNSYLKVKNNRTNRWNVLHRVIAENFFRTKMEKNLLVHHKNYNSLDNSPENLEIMTFEEHSQLHKELSENLKKYTAKYFKGKTKFQIDLHEKRKKISRKAGLACSQKTKERLTGKTYEQLYGEKKALEIKQKQSLSKLGKTKSEILGSELQAKIHSKIMSEKGKGKFGKYERTDEIKEKISNGLKGNIPWNKGKTKEDLNSHFKNGWGNQYGKNYNHKITSIEILPELVDVYDLTVEDYHNFAIESGVFVHNCSLTYKTVPILQFSVARGGDWIDHNSAKAVGKTASKIMSIKESGVDLVNPLKGDFKLIREKDAIVAYYKALVNYVLDNFITEFSKLKDIAEINEPIPIVISGGTSLAGNFKQFFETQFKTIQDFPLKISAIKQAQDPLNSVAKGLLILALSE